MPYTKVCAERTCGQSFVTSMHEQQHCSRACAVRSRRLPKPPCGFCGKQITRPGREVKYCSRKCYNDKQREGQAVYKAQQTLQRGYRRGTVDGRRLLEHRYVMEQHLGRRLLPEEIVHHRDGNKANNALDNLLLTNPSEHRSLLHRAYAAAEEKECTRCREVKPRSEFPRAKVETTDSHMLHCFPCRELTLIGRRQKRRQSVTHATRLRPERFASETEKTCLKCGEIKPRSEFWRAGPRTPAQDPHAPRCKVCASKGSTMRCCQIREDQFLTLQEIAGECGVSVSALLRNIIDRHLNRNP